jgi:hypothetical protein
MVGMKQPEPPMMLLKAAQACVVPDVKIPFYDPYLEIPTHVPPLWPQHYLEPRVSLPENMVDWSVIDRNSVADSLPQTFMANEALPSYRGLQPEMNSQQLPPHNPLVEVPDSIEETEVLREETRTLLLGCFFSAFSQQCNPYLLRPTFLEITCSSGFPRAYMLLMCSLGSDKLGEGCREKGYQGLFEGHTRTISADVFDLTIKLNFWERYPTDETKQLSLAKRLFEVVWQRYEQLHQISPQTANYTGTGAAEDDEWNLWMNPDPE